MGIFDKLFNRPPKPGRAQDITGDEFDRIVQSSNMPVVIDLYSNRCPPCHVMGGLLNEIGPDFIDRVALYKLNVDKSPEIAARLKVASVPTVIFIRDGKVVDKVVGLLPMIPLREKFDRLARKA